MTSDMGSYGSGPSLLPGAFVFGGWEGCCLGSGGVLLGLLTIAVTGEECGWSLPTASGSRAVMEWISPDAVPSTTRPAAWGNRCGR